MKEYYIVPIEQEEATPFAIEHMLQTGTIYAEEWVANNRSYITWFGAKYRDKIEGVLGIVTDFPEQGNLYGIGLYGNPHAVKILLDYFMRLPQPNKFGHVEVNNPRWISALKKRGWEISPIVEHDTLGNKAYCARVIGESKC
jgi:hypothetical protein